MRHSSCTSTEEHDISHELEDIPERADHRLAGAGRRRDGELRVEPAVPHDRRRDLLGRQPADRPDARRDPVSWSLIRPVRKVDAALGLIAEGHFDEHVEVPNRDEFGSLTNNLNRTTEQPGHPVLGPPHAERPPAGDGRCEGRRARAGITPEALPVPGPRRLDPVRLAGRHARLEPRSSSRRSSPTSAASRRRPSGWSPRSSSTELNDYFTVMTDIVFKHGGTLDKYVGDAVMVFFGDPIPQDDHAERAVRMGFEMLTSRSAPCRNTGSAATTGVLRDRDRHRDRLGHGRRHRLAGAERLHGARQRGEPRLAARRPSRPRARSS